MLQEYVLFKGLQPPIDRRRVDAPYVYDGQNFIVDIDGPVSALGTEWLISKAFQEPRGAQILGLRDEQFDLFFAGNGICRYDFAARQLYPVYSHVFREAFWPWSRATCGNRVYYANYEVGLLEYDPFAGTWQEISGGNLPDVIVGICNSGGRLVVLGNTTVHWSEIDNGTNAGFATSLTTGAGFQTISYLSAGAIPVAVLEYSGGFLVYTNRGIMRMELVLAANPFRVSRLSTEHKIINPWCVQALEETDREQHIFLTARGLYATGGENKPEIWQPVMSEHLHRNVIPGIQSGVADMTFRLDQNFAKGWLSVSYASDSRKAIFSKSLIYYIPTQEWGSYDFTHTGFGEIQSTATATTKDYAVILLDGTVSVFNGPDANRTYPASPTIVDFRGSPAPELRYFNNVTELVGNAGSSMTFVEASVSDMQQISRVGIYERFFPVTFYGFSFNPAQTFGFAQAGVLFASGGSKREVAVREFDSRSLEAYVEIGPIYVMPREEGRVDQLTQMQTAIIGQSNQGVEDTFEDWAIDPVDDVVIDWNTEAETVEDWGVFDGNLTEYATRFIGTIDGYNVWENNDIVPEEVQIFGRSKFLAGAISGMFLSIRIDAQSVGESFHVKTIRTDVLPAGRVF